MLVLLGSTFAQNTTDTRASHATEIYAARSTQVPSIVNRTLTLHTIVNFGLYNNPYNFNGVLHLIFRHNEPDRGSQVGISFDTVPFRNGTTFEGEANLNMAESKGLS